MCHNLLIHSLVDEHLSCFQYLVIKNKAVMNIWVQTFVWKLAFFSLSKYLREEMPGYGRCVFNFLRNF